MRVYVRAFVLVCLCAHMRAHMYGQKCVYKSNRMVVLLVYKLFDLGLISHPRPVSSLITEVSFVPANQGSLAEA